MEYGELLKYYCNIGEAKPITTSIAYNCWPERRQISERRRRFMGLLKKRNPIIYNHFLYGAPLTNIQKDELSTISRNFKG
ncbi:hypothetical protein HOR87_gp15 [Marinomonas phage CB5A]|uniref:Uncharacterized protein n=1 Tax=Marinomonas phage CB5A TaxID=2022859 RepID=A0A222G3U4_9CAUD|nr:hypothetical protein HOR87_gp15 [Marinomonas phage CB5A]ASP46253.1 hypothetical protein [Marinomonas phage CB5A]